MPTAPIRLPNPTLTPNQGLTSEQAGKLLEKFGPNTLPEKEEHPLLKFLSYFWGPIPWMIEAAAILSAAVGHWADFIIISILLVVNSVVGFWEEFEAGNIIASLKQKLALQARVKRDSQWTLLQARELVPGDLIRVRMGDIVPADATILSDDRLSVDQSALTGESLPATRKKNDLIYSGSVIKQGEANALVSATGARTYFGKTAQLTEQPKRTSHFQKAVLKIGNFLILLAIALVALILWVALTQRHESLPTTLEFCLVLTVAAIPVALPTVLSVTLAIGARKLGREGAVVSRLASIKEVAGIDILCSDKTGTLTQNKLTLGAPFAVSGESIDNVITCGALASREEDQDPIDLAILSAQSDSSLKDNEVQSFQPFDPVIKRSEAQVRGPDGKLFRVTKGAVQVVLALSANREQVQQSVDTQVADFARRGFRSLGAARTDDAGAWQFVGVLPLYDPPRADSRQTLESAASMGVQVKMLTGDQSPIATEIARELGLGTRIRSAECLPLDPSDRKKALVEIKEADGFAQVFPEHKFRIVETLQTEDHIVGMTGDGVNDAPALKKADVGIAVSGATDAARSAADIVLLQPGLTTIISAIQESRRIFNRMLSYATYRISETIRVLLFMTASILVFNFYPVTPIMIVLLALLNDGAILSIAYDHAIVSDRPERWQMKTVLGISTLLGLLGVASSFTLFFLADRILHLPRPTLQTLMYLKLSVAGHLTIFVTRVRGPFWSLKPSRILVAAVVGTQIIATLISFFGILMPPLAWQWILFVWGYALVWFLLNDQIKVLAYRVFFHPATEASARK